MWSKIQQRKLALTRNWKFPFKERLAAWLFPFHKQVEPHYEGLILSDFNDLFRVNTQSYIEYKIATEGAYEPYITRLMLALIKPGDMVLDVGANIGVHTVPLAKYLGSEGTVHAFEPIPFIYKKLQHNLLLNKVANVQAHCIALSNQSQKLHADFSEKHANQGTFSLHNTGAGLGFEITCMPGSEYLRGLGVQKIDLIKIDVEGYELQVLQGLLPHLQLYHPALVFEYDVSYLKRSGTSHLEFSTLLVQSLEYSLYVIKPYTIVPITTLTSINGMEQILALHHHS